LAIDQDCRRGRLRSRVDWWSATSKASTTPASGDADGK
jgi:hypothetical protein